MMLIKDAIYELKAAIRYADYKGSHYVEGLNIGAVRAVVEAACDYIELRDKEYDRKNDR